MIRHCQTHKELANRSTRFKELAHSSLDTHENKQDRGSPKKWQRHILKTKAWSL